MSAGDAIVLPLTWRSYARAAFFTAITLGFGASAIAAGSVWLTLVGMSLTVAGLVLGADFWFASRRWAYADGCLVVPRAWARDRTVAVLHHWAPGLHEVVRSDSMFLAPTSTGHETIVPNLLLARTDVMQWLHLIGEARQR